MNEFQSKPWSITILLVLLILLGLGGIGGGIVLLMDPSGQAMGLPPDLLDGLFIDNYFLPGLFLIAGMGLLPYIVWYAVWKRLPWARKAVIGLGLLLILWIILQISLWGSPIRLQYIYLGWGFCLIVLSALPGTRKYLVQNQ